MSLREDIQSKSDFDLNSLVWGIQFDFNDNRKHLISTFNYCLEDIQRMYTLYIDMGNTGHYVFDDAIRFKMIKLVEGFKFLSNIVRFKFYGNLKGPSKKVFEVINKDILTDDMMLYLDKLFELRNGTAHEIEAYECYMLEQESENIKNDLENLTNIFNTFIYKYEERMGIKFKGNGWVQQNRG